MRNSSLNDNWLLEDEEELVQIKELIQLIKAACENAVTGPLKSCKRYFFVCTGLL